MLSPQQVADKWASKAGAAVNDYKTGIQGVTTAPGQLAVAQQAVMVNKWNESVNSGLWAARTGAVGLGTWQQAALGKGAANYGTGITAGKPKMAAAMQYFLPVAQAIKDGVKQFPRDGGSGSLARVQFAMQAMQAAKQNRR